MKLAVVGAGSTYTPEVIDGIVRLRHLMTVDDLFLHDTNEQRLSIVSGLAQRMLGRAGHPTRLHKTTSLEEAVEGADAVLIQIRVGGQAARMVDESVPVACGCIGQETTGFGGLAKALRTVPVVLDIAERARDRSPNAWIVDFTNPVGIVTKALLDDGHKAVGLCSAAMVFQRHFAKVLDVEPERIELDHLGLNHLTWEVGVRLDGEDVLPTLLADEHAERVARATGLPAPLVQRLGTVPSYYLHYFYEHDAVVDEERRSRSRAEVVSEIERRAGTEYSGLVLNEQGYERFAAAGLDRVNATLGATEEFNKRNANASLAHAIAVEPGRERVEIRIADGVGLAHHPRPLEHRVLDQRKTLGHGLRHLAPHVGKRGLVAHVTAYEELALDAALRGGRERVFRALLAHPLIGQAAVAETLADRMIDANRRFLPWAQ